MRIRNFDEIRNIDNAGDWEVVNTFYRFGGHNETSGDSKELIKLERLLRSDEEIDKIIYNKLKKLNN